jgi:hypothetical protein
MIMSRLIAAVLLCLPITANTAAETRIYMDSFQEVIVPVDPITKRSRVKRVHVDSLVDIFTHKSNTWIDGSPVVVLEFPENSIEHKLFVIQNLAMTPYQYKTRKERYLYRGRAIPPIIVKSQEQMYMKLMSTNNSIGYLKDNLIYKDEKNLYVVEVIY